MKRPAGQMSHMGDEFELIFPNSHALHFELPAIADVPAKHDVHTDEDVVLVTVPAAHSIHVELPGVPEYLPVPHDEHVVRPTVGA